MIAQIYEIQTPGEAQQCIEAGVDHIGSVILSASQWKQPEIREVVRVGEGTSAKNSIIPLFQERDVIFKVLDYYRPDFIHFCETLVDDRGSELALEKYIRIQQEVKEAFPDIGIIRSIPLPLDTVALSLPTLSIAKKLQAFTDLFLTDTWLGKEPVEGFIGITGKRCRSGLAQELIAHSRIPVILAGGLSPDNVYDAVMDTRPSGADSCTLTNALDKEGRPLRFRKDFLKVKRFVAEVRRAERELLRLQ